MEGWVQVCPDQESINALALTSLSSGERVLLAGDGSGQFWCLDPQTGALNVSSFQRAGGHTGAISSIHCWGEWVYSSSYDCTVVVWRERNGVWVHIRTLRGHTAAATSVNVLPAEHPDETRIVSGGYDGCLRVWLGASGSLGSSSRQLGVPIQTSCCSHGLVLCGLATGEIASVDLTAASPGVLGTLRHHTGPVTALCSQRGWLASAATDGQLCLWKGFSGTTGPVQVLALCSHPLYSLGLWFEELGEWEGPPDVLAAGEGPVCYAVCQAEISEHCLRCQDPVLALFPCGGCVVAGHESGVISCSPLRVRSVSDVREWAVRGQLLSRGRIEAPSEQPDEQLWVLKHGVGAILEFVAEDPSSGERGVLEAARLQLQDGSTGQLHPLQQHGACVRFAFDTTEEAGYRFELVSNEGVVACVVTIEIECQVPVPEAVVASVKQPKKKACARGAAKGKAHLGAGNKPRNASLAGSTRR